MRLFRLPSLERVNDTWIAGAFDHEGFDYNEIPGEQLKHATSYDTNKIYYNCSQIQRVCELVNAGIITDADVFYVDDLNVDIHSQLFDVTRELRTSIYGYMSDVYQTSMSSRTMAKFNGVFLPSDKAKEHLQDRDFPVYKFTKTFVVGYPFNVWSVRSATYKSESYKGKSKKQILFPYGSMGINLFLKLADIICDIDPDISFVVIKDRYTFAAGRSKIMLEEVSKHAKITVVDPKSREEDFVLFAQSSLVVSTYELLFDSPALLALSLDVPVFIPYTSSNKELLSGYDHNDFVYDFKDRRRSMFDVDLPRHKESLKTELTPLCQRIVKLVNREVDENIHTGVLQHNNSIANISLIIKEEERRRWWMNS